MHIESWKNNPHKGSSTSYPNHCMSVYLLLVELCRELEKMMNSFWWGCNKSKRKEEERDKLDEMVTTMPRKIKWRFVIQVGS